MIALLALTAIAPWAAVAQQGVDCLLASNGEYIRLRLSHPESPPSVAPLPSIQAKLLRDVLRGGGVCYHSGPGYLLVAAASDRLWRLDQGSNALEVPIGRRPSAGGRWTKDAADLGSGLIALSHNYGFAVVDAHGKLTGRREGGIPVKWMWTSAQGLKPLHGKEPDGIQDYPGFRTTIGSVWPTRFALFNEDLVAISDVSCRKIESYWLPGMKCLGMSPVGNDRSSNLLLIDNKTKALWSIRFVAARLESIKDLHVTLAKEPDGAYFWRTKGNGMACAIFDRTGVIELLAWARATAPVKPLRVNLGGYVVGQLDDRLAILCEGSESPWMLSYVDVSTGKVSRTPLPLPPGAWQLVSEIRSH